MTYTELYQILVEAEERAATATDAQVRANSEETVCLCLERLARDGLSRLDLARDVLGEYSATVGRVPHFVQKARKELQQQ